MDSLAITGANGAIGRAVLLRALQEDPRRRVRVLVRKEGEFLQRMKSEFAGRVQVVLGDIRQVDAADALVQDARVVVHCAGLTREQAGRRNIHETNVDGTLQIAGAAARVGARLVHLSTSAVYGEASGSYGEDTDLSRAQLATHYARSKREAEERLVALAQERRLAVDILRPTIVYGPLCSWTVDVVQLILKGVPLVVSGGGVPIDAIHVDDVARAVVLSADSRSPGVRAFNIAAGPGPTWGQFFAAYGTLLRRSVRTFPPPLFRLLAALIPPFRVLRDMQLCPKEYLRERAQEELGFVPRLGLGFGFQHVSLWLGRIARRELSGADTGGLDRVAERLAETRDARPLLKTPTFNQYEPVDVLHASTEAEVQDAVHFAATTGRRLRPHGRLHSFAPLPEGQDLMLNMDSLTGLCGVEGNQVTVRAGTHLRDAVELAVSRGLTLPNLGAMRIQSVAGAISTGIHGSSLRHGGISDAVERLVLVRPDAQRVELVRGDPDFSAAALSLGLLGVVTEVTLRCEPRFWLEEERRQIAPEELTDPEKLQRWPAEHEFVELSWFLRSGVAYALTRRRVSAPAQVVNWMPEPQRFSPLTIWGATRFTQFFGDAILQPPVERALQRHLWRKSPRVDEAHRILSVWRTTDSGEFPTYNFAVAVPLANGARALREVFALVHRHPIRPYLLDRILVRFQPASEAWLSPGFGGPVCWVEFWVHRTATPPGIFEWLCDELHELLAPLGYRPHWAKHGKRVRAHLAQALPRFEQFTALRRKYDPKGTLLNPMLQKLFG